MGKAAAAGAAAAARDAAAAATSRAAGVRSASGSSHNKLSLNIMNLDVPGAAGRDAAPAAAGNGRGGGGGSASNGLSKLSLDRLSKPGGPSPSPSMSGMMSPPPALSATAHGLLKRSDSATSDLEAAFLKCGLAQRCSHSCASLLKATTRRLLKIQVVA